jgi:hypothetical protein
MLQRTLHQMRFAVKRRRDLSLDHGGADILLVQLRNRLLQHCGLT